MKRTGPNVFLPAPARAATTARTARTASNIRPACHSRKAYRARTARSTPVGLDPLLQRMRRFQFLRELDWAELNELAASAVVVELAAGRCVTRPRRSLPGRWFLLDGVLVDEVTGRRLRSDRKCGQAQLYPGYEHLVALTKVRLLRVDSPVPPVIPAQQSGSIESVIDVLEPDGSVAHKHRCQPAAADVVSTSRSGGMASLVCRLGASCDGAWSADYLLR